MRSLTDREYKTLQYLAKEIRSEQSRAVQRKRRIINLLDRMMVIINKTVR